MNMFDEIIPQKDGQVKMDHVLHAYRKKDCIHFIEVGAHDGIKNDPIYKWAKNHNWTGILIEPVRSEFNKLKNNYEKFSSSMIFINAVVSTYSGTIPFFVNPKKTGLASVYKSHSPKSHKQNITCVTLNQVIESNNFGYFDLLQIDAEGHDFEVLKSINLNIYHPNIIEYEHRHLSRQDKVSCDQYLIKFGYTILKNRNNTLGIKDTK